MELTEILNEIEECGLRVVIRSGVLFVGPGEKMTDDLREAVKGNTARLMAALSSDGDSYVEWRLAAMLAQLLPLSWPCSVPTLCAAPDAQSNKEACASCGEIRSTGEGDSYVCGTCARAKSMALKLWMQRPAVQERVA
jgi:hypothetical protein